MRSLAVRIAGALTVVALALSGCIPENRDDRPGWGLFPPATGANDTGESPGVLVVGDSLVFGIAPDFGGPQEQANSIRFWTGKNAVVQAAGGASYAHYMTESLLAGLSMSTIPNLVAFFQPRITVVALGSNDGRIITSEVGIEGAYTLDDFQGVLDNAVNAGLSVANSCVVLVNVAEHWSAVDNPAQNTTFSQTAQAINNKIQAKANDDARVRLANWHSHSVGHPDWFAAGNDIHHSEDGKDAYRDFITNRVGHALNTGC